MENFKYRVVSIGIMNEQINVRLPENLLRLSQIHIKKKGYANIQDLLKIALREKIQNDELKEKISFLKKEKVLFDKGKKYTRKDVGF
jgi:Arc/MetJ-type ribon-helix-helix transcriptional regulator